MTKTTTNFSIKFSHRYWKMPLEIDAETPVKKAKLLGVFLTDKNELGKDFLQYDTFYLDKENNEAHYPLPTAKLLVLLLQSKSETLQEEELWTTVRTKFGVKGIDKELYYRSHIGDIAEIVIEDEQ